MSWVKQIFAVSVFSALLLHLLPQEKYKEYVKLVCGVILTLVCVSPVINFVFGGEPVITGLDKLYNMQSVYELEKELDFDISRENESLVEIYVKSVKKDIKYRCTQAGLNYEDVSLVIDTDESSDEYGKLQKITVEVDAVKTNAELYEKIAALKKELVEVYGINSFNVSVNPV